jgi:UDP-3-O-[3-hydroxymyristoyl] glucosamine N-acyltransferase
MLERKSVVDLAKEFGLELKGSSSIELNGVASLDEAMVGDLSFMRSTKYLKAMTETKASVVIVPVGTELPEDKDGKAFLISEDPYISFAKVLESYYCVKATAQGVSKLSEVHESVVLGEDITIEVGVFVGEDSKVGTGSRIQAGSRIGRNVSIGENVMIFGCVVIEDNCIIGDGVILNPGVVIGGDGFGYTQTEEGNVKLPQIGNVILGDNVEVGANSTIDRASLGSTIIGRGTKIDNGVQVGHGAKLGEHCVICSQSGIAGSVVLGDKVIMASRAGIGDHLKVANNVTIGPMAGVTKDISEPGGVYSGFPAIPHHEWLKAMGTLAQLPALRDQFRTMFKK